ncbi:MAG: Aminomethyltransferase (glycine cleavage system protein) [Acidobacteria bacterium]|nr:Aminomethyltransferase (glycine cleavage system protein) [Acidobacteriota bacterium]
MSSLEEKLHELAEKVIENNLWRQRRCFNLIPSENTPSLFVKLCEISDPSGRYAEHKTALKKETESLAGTGALKGDQVYYYQGADFIYQMEQRLRSEFAAFIGARDVETRPVSGQMANEIVFKGLVKFLASKPEGFPSLGPTGRLHAVLNNNLNYGGHLSAQPYGALYNLAENTIVNFPIARENPYKTDSAKMLELVEKHRPALIVFGKSMFLHPEPIRELRQYLDAVPGYRPLVMYDGAHVLGILGPSFQDPLSEGAEILTGSTHKTFFGPQRGIIASKLPEEGPSRKLWSEIVTRTFPGATSNHHLGTQLAMLAATIEMNAFKEDYQSQVLSNARAFAKACAAHGIPVEGGEAEGYTHTHQVIIRVASFGDAKEIASRLEANSIITNYQALPGDETFYHPSGIRMGVQEMTRFGMKGPDFDGLARFIADVILRRKDVASEVAEFRGRFQTMEYCLSTEQTVRVAPRIFESLFPARDTFTAFVGGLKRMQL